MSDAEDKSLRKLLAAAHIEVMPIAGIEEHLRSLATGATVAVTCSPSMGIDTTLEATALICGLGFDAVPHLAARQITGMQHLKRILDELSESGVNSIFVPGGDLSPPAGEFDSALQVLQAMSTFDHGITDIGVAAYPDGHPFMDDETLVDVLRAKQEFATHCVTQMCFNGETITNWIDDTRKQDISLPVRIGLPGAVERKKLLAYSLRIGVGDAARFSLKQPKTIRKLMAAKTYQPDELVLHLAGYLENAQANMAGLHLYTFNQVEETIAWRAAFLAALDEK